MRRAISIPLALAMMFFTAGVVGAQTEIEYDAIIRETFGRSASPSGVGIVRGYGFVTESFQFLGEVRTGDPRCPVTTTGLTTLTFDDGSTLVTLDEQTLCIPGSSGAAPGSQVSFGNPHMWVGTWEVVDGSGAFEGATGAGTLTVSEAGDVLLVTYEGTLRLVR